MPQKFLFFVGKLPTCIHQTGLVRLSFYSEVFPALPLFICVLLLSRHTFPFPQVFSAAGLNVKTDTRVEHLPESEKKKQKSFSPLQDFLGMAQNQASNTPAIEPPTSDSAHSEVSKTVGPRLTMEQYFTEPNNKEEPDSVSRGGGGGGGVVACV